ncbi:hypothetical protein FHS34_007407 [Streptomyces echinatus]|uniref:Uncharacterized protein n=1 Tax=Streptomyces echinatus TaxID=67293 RepID=A0A7W9Q1H4_9ACTN|nr:hypothetical protein [Streptomyces echinatus]MBB5931898.1 hypothetical protein [Streptomyces echinatus]
MADPVPVAAGLSGEEGAEQVARALPRVRAEVVFTYQRLMPVEKVIAGDWR